MIHPPTAFDRHLDPRSAAPIAVAYSGGGDSLMALKLTKAWADRHGRSVTAFCVDHRLQAASGAWTKAAAETATRLGAGFRALVWTGDKPTTGQAAAARAARHRLIADAARDIGARVVVFGHTADDILEADLMRAEGLRLGRLKAWGPSPAWPEGRGLFLLRPLLTLRRATIRADLAAAGEVWIEDPANTDPRSPRARVRPKAGEIANAPPVQDGEDPHVSALAAEAMLTDDGAIRFDRERLRAAPWASLHRLLAAALTCAGGGNRPPRGRSVEALAKRLRAPDAFAATLCGAKIVADEQILIVRDAGEARRQGLAPLALEAARTGVWDGRFEIVAGAGALTTRALAGHTKALDAKTLMRLMTVDPVIRPALPAVEHGNGLLTCPILAEQGPASARSLIKERFLGACGVNSREPAT